MPKLPTWSGTSSFSYTGSVKHGTKIRHGNNGAFSVTMTALQYTTLLNYFRRRTVEIGTSRTQPPRGSLGEWLQANVTRTAIASYVGPILIAEGFAARDGSTRIRFR